jgi:two-component system, cell cycle response regulator
VHITLGQVPPVSTAPATPEGPVTSDDTRLLASLPPPGVTLDVLVVDDDDYAREIGAAVVERLGHRCRTAVDGHDALRVIAESAVDVIVSDWDMPCMSGVELCQKTRSRADDAPYTYFILVTAFKDRAHMLGGMAAGADDYQRKPLNVEDLEGRLISAGRVVLLHRRLAAQAAELRESSARLYVASRTDALTGAGNRLALDEELENLLTRAERYGNRASLAICDLDFFKGYNDHFGHVAGDAALRKVAGAMQAALRSVDLVYRYGGEEFVVVLVEQQLGAAERAMDRLRSAIERLDIDSPATGGALTLSVGVAELDRSRDRTAADWLRRADGALYEAKAAGRNRVMSTVPPAP